MAARSSWRGARQTQVHDGAASSCIDCMGGCHWHRSCHPVELHPAGPPTRLQRRNLKTNREKPSRSKAKRLSQVLSRSRSRLCSDLLAPLRFSSAPTSPLPFLTSRPPQLLSPPSPFSTLPLLIPSRPPFSSMPSDSPNHARASCKSPFSTHSSSHPSFTFHQLLLRAPDRPPQPDVTSSPYVLS